MEKKSAGEDIDDDERFFDDDHLTTQAPIDKSEAKSTHGGSRREPNTYGYDSDDKDNDIESDEKSTVPRSEINSDFKENTNNAPSIRNLLSMTGGGYNQTYLIMKSAKQDVREVFFRCGQWCYKGDIEFFNLNIGTAELPSIIPALQRQQGKMRYFCPSKAVPMNSLYCEPLRFIEDAVEFIGTEIISDKVEKELKRWSGIFRWIQEDNAKTYFELIVDPPAVFAENIEMIATKTYNHGLVIVSIYFQNAIYFVLQDGEGDQPLLDVSFPNVSRHGQGLLIANYHDQTLSMYKKMTLWHNLEVKRNSISTASESKQTEILIETKKASLVNVSSKEYMQTYCIKKISPAQNIEEGVGKMAAARDVLFRFGNWCYAGKVQLIPTLSLSDIPFVIPALRMQQSKLAFLCDTSSIPDTNEFASALQYMKTILPILEDQISQSEATLVSLIDRLTNMGVGDSVSRWLEGDSINSFFEIKVSPDDPIHRIMKDMDLIATKCYLAGIITITIIFQHTIYLCLQEGNDDNPLLDSRFPDISGKGRGYQLQAYDSGIAGWSTLRKISVWQTVAALEEEFRERTATLIRQASAKSTEPATTTENNSVSTNIEEKDTVAADRKLTETHTIAEDKPASASPTKIEDITHMTKETDDAKESEHSPFLSPLSASELMRSSAPVMMSRPHHIPKMETLSKKVEELRRALDNDGEVAPWDSTGKPLTKTKPLRK